MSHSVQIKTQFKSQKALIKAFEELKWRIVENSKIRTYHSDPARNKNFQLVAVNPNGYDVGITITEDEINLTCDFYSPGNIAKTLGEQFAELKKKYVINVTKEHYDDVEIVEMLADGSLIIEADDGE